MQPLKPEDKKRILEENPQAAPADIERYEQLLSERFTVDPDAPSAAPARAGKGSAAATAGESIEQELQRLHARLFGSKSKSDSLRSAHN